MLVAALAALALTAPVADIAVFPAAGEQRVVSYAPPAGNRFLVSPCWAAPDTLVTINEGPPTLMQRREADGKPVTLRRLPRGFVDASIAPGCGAVAELRGPDGRLDVWLRSGSRAPRRVLNTRTHWESRPRFAWTPDARRVAVAPREFDARLRVINVATGRVVRGFSLRGRDGIDNLSAQAISPDGRLVVFSGDPSPPSVRIADVRTGKVRVLVRAATAAAFSRTGDRIAVSTAAGLRIVDLAGRTLTTIPGVFGEHLAWSPDDTRLAVGGYSSEFSVGVIDLTAASPRLDQRLAPTSSFSAPPVWSPDGTQLAVERSPF